MKTVAIISQKGGTGKTTLAINLAVAAMLKKQSVGILDIDPQASAFGWFERRDIPHPVVISTQAAALSDSLKRAKQAKADLMIIDTSPHSESAALKSAKLADLVLIPCRPAAFDLRAIEDSIEIASLAKKSAHIVFNQCPHQGASIKQGHKALKQLGATAAPISIGHRVAYGHAVILNQGVIEYEPSGKASDEIGSLYKWLVKILK